MEEAKRVLQYTEPHLDISANVLHLLEQQAHFKQAARISEGLFTYLSHAGRTGLTSFLGTLDDALLGEWGPVSPELLVQLERMNENVRRLLGDIEQANEIALLEAGPMQPNVRRTQDLVAFLRLLTQRFQQTATCNETELHFQTELDYLDLPFCANRLNKAFSNLVLFALKHTSPGGNIRVTVKREGLFQDAYVTVTIRDAGSGAATRLMTFFDGVQQTDIDSSYGQLDLGLLLALKLLTCSGHHVGLANNAWNTVAVNIRLHEGGAVAVPDSISAPTSFFAEGDTLPGPVTLAASVALPAGRAKSPEQELEPFGRPTVLLVNGSDDRRSYLRSCLRLYRIVEAVEGAEALHLIHEQRPDLIICDLVLPGLGAPDLLRTLKADPHLVAIPFILTTNRASEHLKVDMLKAGAAAYLIEPFSATELQARVHNLLKLGEREKKMQTLAHQAQLAMLRYQLNPHFLFNALNAIRSLTLSDIARSRQMVTALSEYLRYSLRTANDLEASLQEEITSVLSYLDIEKIRFEEDLEVCFEIDPRATVCTVPGMLLQPLVENAVKYGMETSPMPLKIDVRGTLADDRLHLEVINTGRWVPAEETQKQNKNTGIGLRNMRQRLDQYYSDRYHFDIREQNGSVKATLSINLS